MGNNKLWEILKEIRIPDHPTCFLGSVHAGQDTTVGTGQGTLNWYKIGKTMHQDYTLSLNLFDISAEYIMESHLHKESEAGNKINV